MHDFLLEIGTEEIPASFLQPAAEALRKDLTAWFRENRIRFGAAQPFFTTRRLAVRFSDVAEEQAAQTRELQGPPKKAAFDAQGKPTKTAFGFAKTHGKEVRDLKVKQTPKGEYVFVVKTDEARPTGALLAQALPGIIAHLPFPKNMRWAPGGFRFARPIRWLVAILGPQIVPFAIEDVQSGNATFGHRLVEPNQAVISAPADYETTLAGLNVVVAPERRRTAIVEATRALLTSSRAEIVNDEELLAETVGIVEAPKPVLCRFAAEYLALPPVVVITALKKHQRCFAVQDQSGKLRSQFVAVTNTPSCDEELVRGWYEKAVESRLKDASFFIEEDLKIGLEGFVEQEKGVTWIEALGTLWDKTNRLMKLGERLAGSAPGADAGAVKRAAYLCKADLLSNMVREKEYTSLQGIMGGVYAARQGEPEKVSRAVGGHYAPRSVGDPLPETVEGRLLSVADKLDNIGAAFVTGEIPTGSEDPYAVRRQATGLLQIVLDSGWHLDLGAILGVCRELQGMKDEALARKLDDFIRERLSLLLADRGVKYDVANAVLAVGWQDPVDAEKRCAALAGFRAGEEFEQLVTGQKRVANILRGVQAPGAVEAKLLAEPAELALYNAAKGLESGLSGALAGHDYEKALGLLLSLRPEIDRFFDDVMVMCEEKALCANRLSLLFYVKSLFLRVADLSQLVLEAKAP